MTLRPDQIDAIRLYWSEGMPCRTIAGIVGVSEPSVKKYTKDLPRPLKKRRATHNKLGSAERSALLLAWR